MYILTIEVPVINQEVAETVLKQVCAIPGVKVLGYGHANGTEDNQTGHFIMDDEIWSTKWTLKEEEE